MSRFLDQIRRASMAKAESSSIISGTEDVDQLLANAKQALAVASNGSTDASFRKSESVMLDTDDLAAASLDLDRCARVGLEIPPEVVSLNDPGNSNAAAVEAYRGLRTRILKLRASRQLCSIAITSAAPSEGKTLTSINLAACCAQLHDLRVLLIDGDLRTEGLTRSLNLTEQIGVAELLAGTAEAESAICATNIENFYVVPSGHVDVPPPELFAKTVWQNFISRCRERFELIIVDCPPVFPLTDFELINGACDGVITVVCAFLTQREFLEKAASQIDRRKLIGAVLNQATTPRQYYTYYLMNRNETALGRSARRLSERVR